MGVRNAARLAAAAAVAGMLLASVVATTSARNLSASSQTIRATWASLEMISSLPTIRCPVTFEGSFHARTLTKTVGSLTGSVTRVIIKEEACVNGRARPKNVPWHIQYAGFTGTLPNITEILFTISRFRIEIVVEGVCTADYGTAEDNATVRAARELGGAITTITLSGETRGTLFAGSGLCPGSGVGGGRGNVMILGGTSRISVTLI
jgi:hypothetical protein